jgi:acetylornithine deacetylase/succinyl-diaminopimelate desuccinylase-like protein
MSRESAIKKAERFFDSGDFFDLLARRVAIPSESQKEERTAAVEAYLIQEMQPYLEDMGFFCRLLDNPKVPRLPLLAGIRQEGDDLPTILIYGHGDTVLGMDERWRQGLKPWELIKEGERWYGRGTADNKGQHTINLAALDLVLKERGRLGFNVKY